MATRSDSNATPRQSTVPPSIERRTMEVAVAA
jgi:hypothetical protein